MTYSRRHSVSKTARAFFLALPAFLLMAAAIGAGAQEARAYVDSAQYRIGEWVPLHLELNTPAGADVTWPLIGAEVEGLEVLDRSALDSVPSDDGTVRYAQSLTLIAFDSGYYPIPAFHFLVNGDSVSTEPGLLRIGGVAVDTASLEVKPIKDPLPAPVTFREVLPWVLGGLGLLTALLLGWLFWKSRQREPVAEAAPEITIPAHEWAEAELRKLEGEGLWQKGEVKAYYSRLTDILRQYIELRFRQPAMESTTDEIVARLKLFTNRPDLHDRVRSTLVLADLVKFAKATPLPGEHESSLETVRDFVAATRQVPETDTANPETPGRP